MATRRELSWWQFSSRRNNCRCLTRTANIIKKSNATMMNNPCVYRGAIFIFTVTLIVNGQYLSSSAAAVTAATSFSPSSSSAVYNNNNNNEHAKLLSSSSFITNGKFEPNINFNYDHNNGVDASNAGNRNPTTSQIGQQTASHKWITGPGSGYNPNLELMLVDVEPEANLFLDQDSIVNSKKLPISKLNKLDNTRTSSVEFNENAKENGDFSTDVDTRHIALVHATNSAIVRATYGPFFAQQTISPFVTGIAADINADNNNLRRQTDLKNRKNSNRKNPISNNAATTNTEKNEKNNKTKAKFKNSDKSAVSSKQPASYASSSAAVAAAAAEQITSYLVTKEVRRSHPVLRVLFYASHLADFRASSHLHSSATASRTSAFFSSPDDDVTLCAAVIVQYQGERLFGTCAPNRTRQNACLAEVIIPALYWPPLDVSNGGMYAVKQQKSSTAKVYYTITHTNPPGSACNDQNFLSLLSSMPPTNENKDGDDDNLYTDYDDVNYDDSNNPKREDANNKVNSKNTTSSGEAAATINLIYLGDVSLVPFRGSYEEVTNDNVVTILIPQEPVYPNSKIYIPVKYTYNPDYPVSAFSLRVQVKPGLKILGAQLSHPNKLWQLSVELGAKQTTATVTAFLRDFDPASSSQQQQPLESSLPDEFLENMSQEVYSWLIEIEESIDITEVNGRIVWQLLYNTEPTLSPEDRGSQQSSSLWSSSSSSFSFASPSIEIRHHQQQEDEDFEKESVKLTSLIDIQKDVVQEILAITKSRELLNTAILNGRQVSRTMRVYQVSAAGSISDITFQCSCSSADESIIKVSPSCTSIYLDGSEVRGSQNATVVIRYGSYIGMGNFIVWMPLIPLDVRVADSKLSQIKGWRVPVVSKRHYYGLSTGSANFFDHREMLLEEGPNVGDDKSSSGTTSQIPGANMCRLRFQQTRVEVYTRFLSSDHNSGREASLLNRRHSLRITHLVRNLLRVTDPKVLRIRSDACNNQVEGVGAGRADVEVISPLTGSVIGSKEIRVTLDRESITRLEVRPISGIKLAVEPFSDSSARNVWTIKTELASRLTKQYQEAILDGRLVFSDRTWISLSELSPADYSISIDTFKGVIAHVGSSRSDYHASHVPQPSSAASSRYSFGGNAGIATNGQYEMPRIIALLPGSGELVHIAINVPTGCQRKKMPSLAASFVDIDVDFQLPPDLSDDFDFNNKSPMEQSALQNDAINYRQRFGPVRVESNYAEDNDRRSMITNDTASFKLKSILSPPSIVGGGRSKRPNFLMNRFRNRGSNNDDIDRISFQRHSTSLSSSSPSSSSTSEIVPSRGSSNHGDNQKNNFQFGIYSLLMIVSVASIIVVALYSMFSFRFRQHRSLHVSTTTTTPTTTVSTAEAARTTSKRSLQRAPQLENANNIDEPNLPVDAEPHHHHHHHRHHHHRGYHHFPPFFSCVNDYYGANGDATVSNAKEWVWVSKDQFENGIICSERNFQSAINRKFQESDSPNDDDDNRAVRQPLILFNQPQHHQQQICDHNGNITTLGAHRSQSRSSRQSANHNDDMESSSLLPANFRIITNPFSEKAAINSSNNNDNKSAQLPTQENNADNETVKTIENDRPSRELLTELLRQQINQLERQQLSTILIPANHKSTKIVHGGSSLIAIAPDTKPPSPLAALSSRTRHIPLPGCRKQSISNNRHHYRHQQHHNQLSRLSSSRTSSTNSNSSIGGGSSRSNCSRNNIKNSKNSRYHHQRLSSAANQAKQQSPPPIPPHRSNRSETAPLPSHNKTNLVSNTTKPIPESKCENSTPPPIPPHRSRQQLSMENENMDEHHQSQLSMRPKHLQLSNKNTPQIDDYGVTEQTNRNGLDYRSMMKMLDRVKESNA